MRALIYLHKRSIINKLKKTYSKPLPWIFTILGIAYIGFVFYGYTMMIDALKINNAIGYISMLLAFKLYLGTIGLLNYFKRKGIIFTKADVHFTFSSPISPKLALVSGAFKSIMIGFIMIFIIGAFGIYLFPENMLQFTLYMTVYNIIELFSGISLIILCYGNEVLSKKTIEMIKYIAYLILILVLIGFLILGIKRGFSANLLINYIKSPFIKMIPIIGWSIAFIQLIFMGVTKSNIIFSIIYIVSTFMLSLIAFKSRCQGDYFEEAEQFADQYTKLREENKNGNIKFSSKKKKLKKGKVEYKGTHAKAIFYRQLLEYKKEPFFIFGIRTLVFFVLSIVIIAVGEFSEIPPEIYQNPQLVLPVIFAYITILVSNIKTKWQEELESPYTFLMPDTKFKKTWNATKIEHIRAFADSLFLVIPAGIYLHLTIIQMILTAFVYVFFNASKLYYYMMFDALLSEKFKSIKFVLGLFKFFFLFVTIMISVIIIAALMALQHVELGFILMILFNFIMGVSGLFVSSFAFGRMEKID